MRKKIITMCLIMILLLPSLQGCVPSEFDFGVDLSIDTGKNLKDLIEGAMADLKEAEKIAGQEVSNAIDQLEKYSKEVERIFFNGLDQTIASLDAAVQSKLRWIQSYTEQVHKLALDIIHATGEEARDTIDQASGDMISVINATELGMQRTTIVFFQNATFLVDTIADRALAIGGIIIGILLIFICTYGWGRLIYGKKMPPTGLQRTLALSFLAFTVVAALLPFTMLSPVVRAYALTPSGNSHQFEIPKGRPSIYRFEPDPIKVNTQPISELLIIHGVNFLEWKDLSIYFGSTELEILGKTDGQIEVPLEKIYENPAAAGRIDVQFGNGSDVIAYSVPVLIATSEPTQDGVIVPEIVGKAYRDAENLIITSGLQVGQITNNQGDTVPQTQADKVLSTDPKEGSLVELESTVDLVVSILPTVQVPDLVGKTFDDAKILLRDSGLQMGEIMDQAGSRIDELMANKVLVTSPAAGKTVKLNSKINLYFSVYEIVRVPDLVGLSFVDAKAEISKLGLLVGLITDISGNKVMESRAILILSTSPIAGTNVRKGAAVNLVVSVFVITPTPTLPPCPIGQDRRCGGQCWPTGNPCP
jgi:beta-lactam-binding protein with PASTA domain